MSDFKMIKKGTVGQLKVHLTGSINEFSKFEEVDLTDVERFTIDLKSLNHVNSVGVKKWLEWLRPLLMKWPGTKIIFQNVPRFFLDQMNTIQGMLPKGSHVESFYLPYFCEKCSQSREVLMVYGQDYKIEGGSWKVEIPKEKCEEADCGLEPDIVTEKYFYFLNSTLK